MGPTFIKLGQIMSMHPDMLPKEYCQELSKLRADVKPLPFSEIKGVDVYKRQDCTSVRLLF